MPAVKKIGYTNDVIPTLEELKLINQLLKTAIARYRKLTPGERVFHLREDYDTLSLIHI